MWFRLEASIAERRLSRSSLLALSGKAITISTMKHKGQTIRTPVRAHLRALTSTIRPLLLPAQGSSWITAVAAAARAPPAKKLIVGIN